MEDSVRLLAIARESFIRDEDGREAATAALLESFKEACRKAGLHLMTDDGIDYVSLWQPPRAKVAIGLHSEPVEVALKNVSYDPIKKEFFSSEPNVPDPLKVLTGHIAGLLVTKTRQAVK